MLYEVSGAASTGAGRVDTTPTHMLGRTCCSTSSNKSGPASRNWLTFAGDPRAFQNKKGTRPRASPFCLEDSE